MDSAPQELIEVSARVGRNPLLVQGPGGNTSLKVADTLWVKASGSWLSEAEDRPIFASLGLPQVRSRLANDLDADLVPAIMGDSGLRPSIETALHALMPHAAVVHAHAIGAMTAGVLADGRERAAQALAGLAHAWIDYRRPGAPLAAEVAKAKADILILQNHGVVVGAETLSAAEALLMEVERRLAFPARTLPPADITGGGDFQPLPDLGGLALDQTAARAVTSAALFPDQVVFLGGAVPLVKAGESPADVAERVHALSGVTPAMLIVEDEGVLGLKERTAAADAVMRALYEVARRIPVGAPIRGLSDADVAALLGWDAETYRIALAQARKF